jgi:ribosomal protein L11 methylase PrmA
MTMVDLTTEPGLELKVVCGANATGAVADVFAHYGFTQGVTIEETAADGGAGNVDTLTPGRPATVRTVLSAGNVPPEDLAEARLSLWLIRQALWVKGRSLPIRPLQVAERPAVAWAKSLEERFSVHAVTERFRVKAPWHDYAPQHGENVIELDAGTAFGTGRHRSTQLSRQTLEEELAAGDHVRDVGVGAGLLAIAAAQLGARGRLL